MSWIGWIIAALVLCPTWARVAREAERLRIKGGDGFGHLLELLHRAALGTAGIIAIMAIASVYMHFLPIDLAVVEEAADRL